MRHEPAEGPHLEDQRDRSRSVYRSAAVRSAWLTSGGATRGGMLILVPILAESGPRFPMFQWPVGLSAVAPWTIKRRGVVTPRPSARGRLWAAGYSLLA